MKITSARLLAQAVRNSRKIRRLTQSDTAEKVGIKQTTISSFENNPDSTKLETLFKILSALNLELYVVSRDEPSPENKQWSQEW
nr:type II toxin-antitoxin system antitoxin HipB [uncultured Moellerella sp.]